MKKASLVPSITLSLQTRFALILGLLFMSLSQPQAGTVTLTANGNWTAPAWVTFTPRSRR